MQYRCTSWLPDFTVGAHYTICTGSRTAVNDEGETEVLSREQIVLNFEPVG